MLNRIREHRGALYLALGATIVGTPVVLTSCQDASAQGVTSYLREVNPGRFVIENEEITKGHTELVITRLDGRVERITDPDRFAQYLPKEAPAGDYKPEYRSGGMGLGDILLFSMVMNAWRPAYYPARAYMPPAQAYTNSSVFNRVNKEVRPTYANYVRRGIAPSGAASYKTMRQTGAQRVAPASRATRPSGGRSGYFGTGSSRGFGG